MTRILIAGDSHVPHYKAALGDRQWILDTGVSVSFCEIGVFEAMHRPFYEVHTDRVSLLPEVFFHHDLRAALPHVPILDAGEADISWYGFSGPLTLYNVATLNSVYETDQLAYSHSLLRQILLDQMEHWLGFLEALRGLGVNVFVLEPPNLFDTSPVLLHSSGHTRAQTILDVDRMIRSIAHDLIESAGITIVRMPEHMRQPNGATRPEYRHPDPSDNGHGNEDFYLEMLKEIPRQLDTGKAGPVGRPVPEAPPPQVASECTDEGHCSLVAAINNTPLVARFDEQDLMSAPAPEWIRRKSAGKARMSGVRLIGHHGPTDSGSDNAGLRLTLAESAVSQLAGKRMRIRVIARLPLPAAGGADSAKRQYIRYGVTPVIPGVRASWRWVRVWPGYALDTIHEDVPADADRIFIDLRPSDYRWDPKGHAIIHLVAVDTV